MKKILLTLVIAVSSLGAAFAGEEVSAKVLGAFKKEFTSAREITWTVADHYYQASFIYNEQYVSAYYSPEGELIGLTRFISPADLPLALQSDLKVNHADFWITDLFEVSKEGHTVYYITLEDADAKIVLKSVDGGSWENYKKVKKA
ncbi:MAG: hypothetical protein ACO25B_10720 [Chitinophagaceae bacterium]